MQNGGLALSGIVVREERATAPAGSNTIVDDVAAGPAVRHFHQGSTADFAYIIYNANQASQLTAQTRLYRDGKVIFNPAPLVVVTQGQSNPKYLATSGRLQLASDMAAGDYVLQIIVTDSADKQKPRVASQWIDFEIVK